MQGQRSTINFQFVWGGLGVCLDEAAGRRVTVGPEDVAGARFGSTCHGL